MNLKSIKYGWLLGSICIWLCCAWVVQQPAPAKKTQPKATRSKAKATRPSTAKSEQTTTVPVVNEAKTGASITATASLSAGQPDPESGLAMDKNLMLVKGNCLACHSSKLILQSHFDREKWVERIRWMQRTQKLWDLGESEPAILTYLTTYYGPVEKPFDGRRLPLDPPIWYKQTGR